MAQLINKVIPILLVVAGGIAMAMSSLVGGGVSALIGLPLFLVGFLWLLLPKFRRRNGES